MAKLGYQPDTIASVFHVMLQGLTVTIAGASRWYGVDREVSSPSVCQFPVLGRCLHPPPSGVVTKRSSSTRPLELV